MERIQLALIASKTHTFLSRRGYHYTERDHKMQAYLIVFFGAGFGGALRHAVNLFSARLWGVNFPFGTLTVNVAGSFAMGVLAAYFALRGESEPQLKLFLTTGILGGFTTFSAFSLDTALLYERGEPLNALLYTLLSVVLSVISLFLGLALMRTNVS